jgi:hypothetical protein
MPFSKIRQKRNQNAELRNASSAFLYLAFLILSAREGGFTFSL